MFRFPNPTDFYSWDPKDCVKLAREELEAIEHADHIIGVDDSVMQKILTTGYLPKTLHHRLDPTLIDVSWLDQDTALNPEEKIAMRRLLNDCNELILLYRKDLTAGESYQAKQRELAEKIRTKPHKVPEFHDEVKYVYLMQWVNELPSEQKKLFELSLSLSDANARELARIILISLQIQPTSVMTSDSILMTAKAFQQLEIDHPELASQVEEGFALLPTKSSKLFKQDTLDYVDYFNWPYFKVNLTLELRQHCHERGIVYFPLNPASLEISETFTHLYSEQQAKIQEQIQAKKKAFQTEIARHKSTVKEMRHTRFAFSSLSPRKEISIPEAEKEISKQTFKCGMGKAVQ